MMISPEHSRAARGLLGWSQVELSERAKMARRTITDFELGIRVPYPRTLEDLQRVFENAGVVFLPAEEGQHTGAVGLKPGVVIQLRQGANGDGADDSSGGGKLAMPADPELMELVEYWRTDGRWFDLAEPSRRALRSHIWGTANGDDAVFALRDAAAPEGGY